MLEAERAIQGHYGKLFKDGRWLTNVNHLEAKAAMEKTELKLPGSAWVRHKKGILKGTGTMSGFKVTSEMIAHGFGRFEIISKLEDPEAFGHERIRLKNCMADEIVLANWTAGEVVEESTPFTFEGYELLDPIEAP
ncbi:MAG: phage tail tube protein [Bacillota bacterium]